MAHGHELAQGAAGPRCRRGAPRRQHHRHERRAAHDQGLCGGRAGAGARVLRRGRQRHGAARPRRLVLPHGQDRGRAVLHRVSLRLHHGRARCLGEARQRPEAVGRALRALRHPRLPRRQHGHADARVVPQGDPFARGPEGPQVPRTGQPGPRARQARRHARDPAGRRDLPGAAVGRDRCRRVDRPVQRPCAGLLPGVQALLRARLPRARPQPAAHDQRAPVASPSHGPADPS